jgi:hypothetical protein
MPGGFFHWELDGNVDSPCDLADTDATVKEWIIESARRPG